MAKRPQHTVRMDDLTWSRFGAAAEAMGTDRAEVLRQFIRWYLRDPGGRIPVRPEPVSGPARVPAEA